MIVKRLPPPPLPPYQQNEQLPLFSNHRTEKIDRNISMPTQMQFLTGIGQTQKCGEVIPPGSTFNVI